MSPTRRDFIKTTAATAAAIVAGPGVDLGSAQTIAAPGADPLALELAKEALDAARAAGASYADVAVGRYRRQTIATRERQVSGVNDSESYGIGVRTLVDGCWGFAATSMMTPSGRQASGARGRCAVQGCTGRAEASRRAGAGGARRRRVDHAGAAGSARGGDRRQDRAAASPRTKRR